MSLEAIFIYWSLIKLDAHYTAQSRASQQLILANFYGQQALINLEAHYTVYSEIRQQLFGGFLYRFRIIIEVFRTKKNKGIKPCNNNNLALSPHLGVTLG